MKHNPNLAKGEASLIYLQPNGFWHRRRERAKKVFFEFMEGLLLSGEINSEEIIFKIKKLEGDV